MADHSPKIDALISWVNRLKVDEPIDSMLQLKDCNIFVKIISKMTGNKEEEEQILQQPEPDRFHFVCNFLQKHCKYVSASEDLVQWQKTLQEDPSEMELSKVVVLLLYFSTMSLKNQKESEELDYKTQTELASILQFVLDNEELCLSDSLADFLQKKPLFPSSSDSGSSADEFSPFLQRRKREVRFLDLHRIASSSSMNNYLTDSPSSPISDVLQTPQFQLRRLKKQLLEERSLRDELELELAENRKHVAEKEAQIFLMQQRIERLVILSEKQASQQEPKELEELRNKNESVMIRLRDALKQCQDLKIDKSQMEKKIDQLSEENGDISFKMRDFYTRLMESQKALDEVSNDQENTLKEWQEKETQLERDLLATQDEKKCLEEKIQILEGKISLLEEQLKAVTESLTQEKGEVMGDILQLESLKQEVAELTAKVAELQVRISQLEREKHLIQEEYSSEKSKFEREKCQLTDLITDLQTSLSEITIQKEKLQQDSQVQEEHLTAQINTLNLEISKLNDFLVQKNKELENLHCQVEEERTQKGQLLEDLKKQEESSRETIQSLNFQLSNLASALKQKDEHQGELIQQMESEIQQIAVLTEQHKKAANERDSALTLYEEYKKGKETEMSSLTQQVLNLEKVRETLQVAIKDLKREKAELTQKVQELDATILDLIAKCQNLESENDTQTKCHSKTVDSLNVQLQELKLHLKEHQQKLADKEILTEENARLKDQLLSLEETLKHLQELLENEKKRYSKTLEGGGKKVLELEQELQNLTKHRDQALQELTKEKANTEKIEALKKQLEEGHQVKLEKLHHELSQLSAVIRQKEDEQEKLTSEVDSWRKQCEDAQHGKAQGCSQLEETIRTLKEAHSQVLQQLQAEQAKVAELDVHTKETASEQQEKLSLLEADLSNALALVKEKESEEKKLLDLVESLQKKLELAHQGDSKHISQLEMELSKVTENLNLITKELAEEKVKKTELEATVKNFGENKSEIMTNLECSLSNTMSSLKEKEREAEKLSGELQELQKRLKERQHNYNQELALKNDELQQLMAEKEQTKADLKAEKLTKAEVQKSMNDHKENLHALQKKLSQSLELLKQKEEEINRLLREGASKQEEITVQQQTIGQLQENMATIEGLKEQIAKQNNEIQCYTETVTVGKTKISELKSVLQVKEKEIKHLEQKIQLGGQETVSMRDRHQEKIQEINTLRSKMEELQQKCKEQHKAITSLQKEAEAAKLVASEKTLASDHLQESLHTLETEVLQHKEKTSELQKILESSRLTHSEQKSTIETLRRELMEKGKELEFSKRTVATVGEELSSMRAQALEKDKSSGSWKEQLNIYRQEIEKKNRLISNFEQEMSNLHVKIAERDRERADLKLFVTRESEKNKVLEEKMKMFQAEVASSASQAMEKSWATEMLKTEVQNFQEETAKQRITIEELKKELNTQKELKINFHQEIKTWQEKCAKKEELSSSVQRELANAQALIRELMVVKSLHQEQQASRSLIESKHQKELEQCQKIEDTLKSELERAKLELSELHSLKERCSQQEDLVKSLQTTNANYDLQLSELKEANIRLVDENQNLCEQSNQGSKKFEGELTKCKEMHAQELEALKLEQEKLISDRKGEVEDITKKLEVVTNKYENAKVKVLEERQKFHEERHKLVSQVEKLELQQNEQTKQIVELNNNLSQQEKTTKSNQQKQKLRESGFQEELQQSKKHVEELQAQIEQMEQKAEHYKTQMEKAKTHYDAKKQQTQELNEELQTKEKDQELLKKENAELKLETERLNKDVQHYLLEVKEADINCKNMSAQVRTLEAQLEFANRQLRELSKSQLATDTLKSRDTLSVPQASQILADVSTDSLNMSEDEEPPLISTRRKGRSNQDMDASATGTGTLRQKEESLESLYFTPISNRVQSKLESSISSLGDLSLDSEKKSRTTRRRTTQIINITMAKKVTEEDSDSGNTSGNTSFYSLRSAPSSQSLHQPNLRKGSRPQAASSLPSLATCTSQESLTKMQGASSEENLSQSVLLSLPGYRLPARRSSRLSQASNSRNSFYLGTCQDEPDPLEDWNRIAELQQRNKICPPHLKTSYPLESQSSRCTSKITDEEVKTGDPKETLRRASMLPSQIHDSTTAASRRSTTVAPSTFEQSWGTGSVTTRQQMKRVSEESHHGPETPESKRSTSCFSRPMTPKDRHDGKKSSTLDNKKRESQQQVSRRQSMTFSILNTPKKLGNTLLRRGINKKTTTPKPSPKGGISKKSPSRKSPRTATSQSPRGQSKMSNID
ncbi:nuclear mitotic apparatus protein 1 isoform X2 [Microcaecilia unicolor]|uniref:Nuclear mitotic apparatus protein 1 isoform X2 n=1 Tax=Microcaecilia unicolor TaxID=1415580 RepID=A0A6P7XRY4_9AMPH|nr:nuclear mitotic apparatus protein 1 isoform X2 [Microcaecilia unicolor]